MRVPPAWLRRPLSLTAVALLALGATTLPLLLVLAAALSLIVPGRWRPLRLLAFALGYLVLEVVGLLLALDLWVASGFGWKLRSESFQRAHYRVLRLLLAGVWTIARALFTVTLSTDDGGWSPLDDGAPGSENAMVVLSRHAGPGDSFLLVRTLLDRDHLRRPRIVLRDTLQLDPLLDLYLNRLPTTWIASRPAPGDDPAADVGRLAAGMSDEDALLLFPEGANFSPGRRTRSIASLRRKGQTQQADRAESMHHVLPPRVAGVQAALAAAPHADVVFVAHTGLEHLSTPRELWRGMPMDQVLHLRWDFVPAAEVPDAPEEQADWLYQRWAQVDDWIGRTSPHQ